MTTDTVAYNFVGTKDGLFHVTSSLTFSSGAAKVLMAGAGSESCAFTAGQTINGADLTFELRGRPRVIDGFRWYWNGGTNTTSGAWDFEGSHDGVSWDHLHSFVEYPTNTGVTQVSLGGGDYYLEASFSNTTEYEFYRFIGTGGGNTTVAPMKRIDFSITSNELESGDRDALIVITTNMTFSGTVTDMINGSTLDGSSPRFPFEGSGAGKYLRFEFPEPVTIDYVFLQWLDLTSQAMGVWDWQGSADALTWDTLKSSFNMSSVRQDDNDGGSYHALTNSTAYTYYQLICVSGTIFDKRIMEMMFNTATSGGVPDLDLTGLFVDDSVFAAVPTIGLPDVVLTGEFADETLFDIALTIGAGPVLLSGDFEDDAQFDVTLTLFNPVPSYNNPGGGGDFADRRYLIEVTSDLDYDAGSTDPNYLVDGWVLSWAPTPGQPVIGKYIQFEFKDGKAYRITELQAVDGGGTDNARWDFEAFDVTTSSWITLKSNFNWDIGAFTNPNPYTKYRFVGYSGNFASMTVDEILFKIAGPYPAPSPPFSAAFVDETEFEAIMTRTGGSLSLAMNFTDETVFNAVLFDNVIPPPIQSIVIVTGR